MTRPELRGTEEGRKGETKERRGRGRKEVVKRKGRGERVERERRERKEKREIFTIVGRIAMFRMGQRWKQEKKGTSKNETSISEIRGVSMRIGGILILRYT